MAKDLGMPSEGDEEPLEEEDDLSSAEGVSDTEDKKDPRSKLPGGPSKTQKPKKKQYTPDDIGNAERLLAEYGSDMRWDESLKEWVIWTGVRWEVDSHKAIRRAMTVPQKIFAQGKRLTDYDPDSELGKELKSWAKQCGNIGRLKAMLETARSFPGVAVAGDGFNADRRVMACPNGALVLGTTGAKFRPVRREDLTTKVTGCEYDPDARSPMFEDFLDKFLPDAELRSWAQRVAGYSMLGGNPKRRIIFCWGPTSSGKSTFAELIQAALGTYAGTFNLSMLRENQDERPRPDLVNAVHQRAIFAFEASSDWKLHADMIKRSTGQDKILARLPHSGTPIAKIPDFTPWVITNNIPTINGADQALYRRLCTVLFPNTIEDSRENEDFRITLVGNGELPGVLAWLVEGWNLYCQDGLSDPPAQVMLSELKMREQFTDIDQFLKECCDTGGGYKEVPSLLYERYEEWCDTNGMRGNDRLTGTKFGSALTARGYIAKDVKVDGKVPRRRLGLRLKQGVKSDK